MEQRFELLESVGIHVVDVVVVAVVVAVAVVTPLKAEGWEVLNHP